MGQDRDALVNATVRRWQLTEQLRDLREAAGLTIEQAGAELQKRTGRWSKSKVWRIETRQQNVKSVELKQLLDLYGITDEALRTQLRELAENANERGWWVAYRRDLPEDFRSFVSLEAAVDSMRKFETLLIPGLLQTQDYARALVSSINPDLPAVQTERRVAARIARQQVLARQDPPQLHVIVDWSVLERQVGTPIVMRAQLRHVLEMADLPNITLQVLPKLAGAHPGLEGSFSILSMPDPAPDIGYAESPAGGVYIEDRDHVRDCLMRFGTLTQLALPAAESLESITEAMHHFDQLVKGDRP